MTEHYSQNGHMRSSTDLLPSDITIPDNFLKKWRENFPSGPVIKILPFNAGDAGLIPGQEAKIPHASWAKNKNIKKKKKRKKETIL